MCVFKDERERMREGEREGRFYIRFHAWEKREREKSQTVLITIGFFGNSSTSTTLNVLDYVHGM